jgi:hypothetical protein
MLGSSSMMRRRAMVLAVWDAGGAELRSSGILCVSSENDDKDLSRMEHGFDG